MARRPYESLDTLSLAEARELLGSVRDVLGAAETALRIAERSPTGSWCLVRRDVVQSLLDALSWLRTGSVSVTKES